MCTRAVRHTHARTLTMPSIEYVRWIAAATVPVAFIIGASQYPAPSYLDRVPRIKNGVKLCLLVAYSVCCAFHLSLMAIATGLLTGVMPDRAIEDLSAMTTVALVVLFVGAESYSLTRKQPPAVPSPPGAAKDPTSGRNEGTWPSLLSMEFSYVTAVLSILGTDEKNAWIQTTGVSSLLMFALFAVYLLALSVVQKVVVGSIAVYMDENFFDEGQKQGCRMIQPHFTWVAFLKDFFAAWPIVSTFALAGFVALFMDTNNLRARSEWMRMLPYLQYSPLVAVATAGLWQWRQPRYHTESTM